MAHNNNRSTYIVIILVLTFTYQVSGIFEWHYSGEIGTHTWHVSYEICANGTHQSPIEITTDQTVYDPDLRTFVIWYNPTHVKGQMTLFNNGKTVKIKTEGNYFIANGGLKNVYKTDHGHFHWGKENHLGSEHSVDRKAWAMELHVVNYDAKRFNSVEEAASEPLGLAVLGIMFETSKTDNPAMDIIIDNLETIQQPGHPKVKLEAISLRSFLPKDLSRYYRYNGSLTTPPCYESVIWTIFDQHNYISHKQMKKLRDLFFEFDPEKEELLNKTGNANDTNTANLTTNGPPTNNTTVDLPKKYRYDMVNNFRPVQPLNDRVVLRSFEHFKTTDPQKPQSAATKNVIISAWVISLLLFLNVCTLV